MLKICSAWAAGLLLAFAASADDASYMKGKRFAVGDYTSGKVCIVEADGSVSWEQKAPNCNDLWIQPNGSILFSTGRGVKEVTKDGKVVFAYTNSASEIFAVQRLPNGNTFVGECTTGRLLELAPDGRTIAKEVDLLPKDKSGGHVFIRNVRVLKNGHFLAAHYGGRYVTEYAPDGTAVWTFKTPGGPHSVARLANGHTLIACGDNGTPCLVEVAADGTIVWQLSNDDLPDKPLKFLTGFQKLPNGNVLISNWLGHGKFGTAPHLLEVTPDKKVVWTYADHKTFKTIATVQVFAAGDTPLDGEGLH
jgi:outer membrane protein assembly factor BamB